LSEISEGGWGHVKEEVDPLRSLRRVHGEAPTCTSAVT
jgi:hypothetical protein